MKTIIKPLYKQIRWYLGRIKKAWKLLQYQIILHICGNKIIVTIWLLYLQAGFVKRVFQLKTVISFGLSVNNKKAFAFITLFSFDGLGSFKNKCRGLSCK